MWHSKTFKEDYCNEYEYTEADLYDDKGYNLLTGEKFRVKQNGDKESYLRIQDIEVWSVSFHGVMMWQED